MALPDWAKIIDNPEDFIDKKVHVVGWRAGLVFTLISYYDGVAVLEATKARKIYSTGNALYELKRKEPS